MPNKSVKQKLDKNQAINAVGFGNLENKFSQRTFLYVVGDMVAVENDYGCKLYHENLRFLNGTAIEPLDKLFNTDVIDNEAAVAQAYDVLNTARQQYKAWVSAGKEETYWDNCAKHSSTSVRFATACYGKRLDKLSHDSRLTVFNVAQAMLLPSRLLTSVESVSMMRLIGLEFNGEHVTTDGGKIVQQGLVSKHDFSTLQGIMRYVEQEKTNSTN